MTEYNYVVVRDEMVSSEDSMHSVAQIVEEIDDGESLMLCSDQHNRRVAEKISTGTSESHVLKLIFGVFLQILKNVKVDIERNLS